MVRGSIVTTRRRCGTPSCRCARGELHEGVALSVSVGGRTTLLTLKDESEVAEATAALERYRAAASALEAAARDGLEALKARLAAARLAKTSR
jgi:hypothetical protein